MGLIRMQFDHKDPEVNRLPKKGYGFIYRYRFRNGKCYIGQTIRTVKERTVNHTDKKMLIDNVLKSGAKFKIDILSEVPIEYLNAAEDYCIYHFNTLYPNGYNLTVGGQANVRIVTEEMRRKVSDGVQRALADPVKGRRMRACSNEQKALFEKMTLCLETGKLYRSMTEAAKDIGCSMSNISACICKYETTHSAKGYHFVKADKYLIENRKELLDAMISYENNIKAIGQRNRTDSLRYSYQINKKDRSRDGVKIRCIETGKDYRSITAAADDMGIPLTSICTVINGRCRHAHGYHFEKVD